MKKFLLSLSALVISCCVSTTQPEAAPWSADFYNQLYMECLMFIGLPPHGCTCALNEFQKNSEEDFKALLQNKEYVEKKVIPILDKCSGIVK